MTPAAKGGLSDINLDDQFIQSQIIIDFLHAFEDSARLFGVGGRGGEGREK